LEVGCTRRNAPSFRISVDFERSCLSPLKDVREAGGEANLEEMFLPLEKAESSTCKSMSENTCIVVEPYLCDIVSPNQWFCMMAAYNPLPSLKIVGGLYTLICKCAISGFLQMTT
jgi:hypothetical protein